MEYLVLQADYQIGTVDHLSLFLDFWVAGDAKIRHPSSCLYYLNPYSFHACIPYTWPRPYGSFGTRFVIINHVEPLVGS